MAVDLFPDRPITAKELKAFSRQANGEAPLKKFRLYVRATEVYEVMAVDEEDARERQWNGHGKCIDAYTTETEVEMSNDQ